MMFLTISLLFRSLRVWALLPEDRLSGCSSRVGTFLSLGFALLLLPCSPLQSAGPPPATGLIEGVVVFTGKVPPPRKVPTTDGLRSVEELVVDKKTRGVRDVVVALIDVPARPKQRFADPAFMDQRDLFFVPRILAVQHGRAVRFDNSDTCNHSVMAVSTLRANTFNVFVPQGKPVDHFFEAQKHPVAIGCSLHAWMKAWIYVFDHPWFAQTNSQGIFQISGVPPGMHTLWIRHAETGLQEKKTIEVKPGQISRITVEWKSTQQP